MLTPEDVGLERTLAGVLHECKAEACLPEKYWLELVQAVGRGNQHALHALFCRTLEIVLPWIERNIAHRPSAEEATLDVFYDVWRRASEYDAAGGSVLAWILSHARSRAIGRTRGPMRPERLTRVSYASLWQRLARRIAAETGRTVVVSPHQPTNQEWEEVAPGISCILLAKDVDRAEVAMLVRLAPGTEYPAHTHAGVEELYMFEGELKVDHKNLRAGDYLRSEPGSSDRHVWSGTGCSGVLITSTEDLLL